MNDTPTPEKPETEMPAAVPETPEVQPEVKVRKKKENVYYATGRRKRAIARVWLSSENKAVSVNGKALEVHFPRETDRMVIHQALEAVRLVDRFGFTATVKGGGLSGQAGAIRLGISRALIEYDKNLRQVLRRNGFLTRDPREKERKKYGRKGARRSFQFTKR